MDPDPDDVPDAEDVGAGNQASKWCKADAVWGSETTKKQNDLVGDLVSRWMALQLVLCDRGAAREVEETEEAEAEVVREAARAVVRLEKVYVVEATASRRVLDEVLKYGVEWEGSSSDHNTREPEANLTGADKLVAQYENDNTHKK